LLCPIQTQERWGGWPRRGKGWEEPIIWLKEEMKDELAEETIRTQKRQLKHIFPDQHRDGSRRREWVCEEQVQNETKTKMWSCLDTKVECKEEVGARVQRREMRVRELLKEVSGGQWNWSEGGGRLSVEPVEVGTHLRVLWLDREESQGKKRRDGQKLVVIFYSHWEGWIKSREGKIQTWHSREEEMIVNPLVIRGRGFMDNFVKIFLDDTLRHP
jgi:hypothetical protein